MVKYLRKRGWIVFKIKKKKCIGNWCWLSRYNKNLKEYKDAPMLTGKD